MTTWTSWAAALLLAAAAIAVAGCEACIVPTDSGGEGEGEAPQLECFYGDKDADPEGELVYRTVDQQLATLVDGQEVPMILPPQGGKVILIGARVKNMDLCSLQANGGMFDGCQTPPRIIGREGRGLQMKINEDLGMAEPDRPETLNNYVNIPLCPNFTAVRDADGEPFNLEIRFSDRAQRSLILKATVTPVCAEPEQLARCTCECDVDFSFERVCEDIVADPAGEPGVCPAGEGEGEGEAG